MRSLKAATYLLDHSISKIYHNNPNSQPGSLRLKTIRHDGVDDFESLSLVPSASDPLVALLLGWTGRFLGFDLGPQLAKTMSAAADTSGADAAGGEAIYSSDGLPPLPTPAPPIKSSTATDSSDDAVLDSETLTPTDAFEVFGGKAYLRPGGGRGGRGRSSAGGGGDIDVIAAETPLVRLARLTTEVSELEKDLASSSASASASSSSELQQVGGVSSDQLTKLARELATRLEVAGNEHGAVVGGSQQDDLTTLVREELAKVQKSTTAAGASDEDKAARGGTGVIYELYASSSSGHVGSDSAKTAAVESSIEERLGRIERAVGAQTSSLAAAAASGGGGKSGRSVLERLDEAERMAAKVDGKALDAAAARAKVIRADLEAAAKAKSKLSAALSTLSADDAKAISSLHMQLQDLEGISAHLPTIVSRLQDLSSLHLQASNFATRLTAVENAATEAERLLRGVEDAVGKVEDGWKANAAAVERNVAALDERIKNLS